MWGDQDTRAAVIQAATMSGSVDRKVRSYALATLLNLSSSESNKGPMLDNQEVCVALCQAAGLSNRADSKERGIAMGTLHNLATKNENRPKMWTSDHIRDRVLAATELTDTYNSEAGVRAHALGVLANLVMDEKGICKAMM